ncbi:MAG: N-acetylmuramoyl-L-alanine amidase, partial [Chloroflexota bacterium]
LQAGHWLTDQVPDELRRLEHSTGASWGGVSEWQVNLEIANRAAAVLRTYGHQVDVLPTTIPAGYLADVFVALHADGNGDPTMRGYKAAHGSRRGPYEGRLVQTVLDEYGRATGLPVDPVVSRNMRGYYVFSWTRFQATAAPHTPAAILEMGFLTNAADRALLLGRPDVVASGVVNGVLRFLDEVPAGAAFAEDLLLPPFIRRSFRTPVPG